MKTRNLLISLSLSLVLGLGLTLALVGLLGSGSAVVRAASFTVDVTNDENDGSCAPGDCSLREAIIAANGNGQADTITLGSGTYALTLIGVNENAGATGDLDITAPLTIAGQGPAQTIIDASGVISDRVFHINMSADTGTVVISGVTIINGNFAGSGGGIYNYDADLTLVNTVISNNISSGYGGGVAISSGSLTLDETQILSNTAGQRGGGVYVYQSSFTQTNGSLIAYNHATGSGGFRGGGGLYVSESSASAMLNGGQIFSNTANDDGGGVYVLYGSAILAGGQILSNTANDDGGGVYVYQGSTMLSGAEIRGNKANSGGGVYVDDDAAVFTQTGDSEIAYNSSGQAATGGGGLYIDEGSATLSGGQIHHNNTAGYGGGVHIQDGSATLNGGQILSNTASNDGGGVYIFGSDGAFTQTSASIIAYNTATTNGGGVYVDNGRATLAEGQILDNKAIDGGGVYVDAGSTMLSGSEILSNTASSDGGGVYVYQGQATLNGGQILSNTASFGGGVHVGSVSAVFTQMGITTIAHNTASDDGGGVFVASGSASLSEGSIRNNDASDLGGGVYVQNSAAKVNVNREQIINNTAYIGGGGIYHNNGTLTLVNTTVSGNRATKKGISLPYSQGGGLYVVDGTVVLTYSTIASNTAASVGGVGGIYSTGGLVLLQDTIVAYNSVANCNTGLTSNDYNLDSGATCGFGAANDQNNTDPKLAPLADNGGNTLTHALLQGSPAVDHGVCVAGITADQRGVARPQGATCDVGAYEYVPDDTTTTLASSPNPSVFGQSVTFTVTVTSAGGTPTGVVAFKDGGSDIAGCSAQPLSGGQATCTTASLVAGTHSITAQYGGDAYFSSSASSPLNQVVNKADTTTGLASSANPSTVGQPVTFTATVASAGGTPTGFVAFKDGGSDIAGCSAQPLSGGQATCTTASLAAGTHSITAQYGGDANFNSSASLSLSQAVEAVIYLPLVVRNN